MENVVFIFILAWFFLLGALFGGWLKEKQLNKKILSKENVVACFKDVDWAVQRFYIGDNIMKSKDGIDIFYKVPSIDAAIQKLNNLMASSPANIACTRPASAVGTGGESDESAGG